MPYVRRKRAYRKRPANKKRPAYKKRSSVSNNIKRYVKRTLHSQIENKIIQTYVPNQTLASCLVTPGLLTFSMIPYTAMTQNVGQSGRIGNKIKTMKCTLKYVITPYPYSVTLNPNPRPHNVVIMIGKVKNAKALTPTAADFQSLYQFGAASAPPQGTLGDLVLPINKDYFTVYKTFIHKVGFESFNNAGVSPNFQHYANNDYKLNIIGSVDVTKYCPKNVLFNDITANPTNDGLFCWAWSTPADGSAYAALTPNIMTYNVMYSYEDA